MTGSTGLTMTAARALWPCSKQTWRRILDARMPDGTPVLRTYPLAPGSLQRRTTEADLQTARERLLAMECESTEAALTRLAATPPESFTEALARKRRAA